jgi:hypothetical protein
MRLTTKQHHTTGVTPLFICVSSQSFPESRSNLVGLAMVNCRRRSLVGDSAPDGKTNNLRRDDAENEHCILFRHDRGNPFKK